MLSSDRLVYLISDVFVSCPKETVTSAVSKAEALNNAFKSAVFTIEDSSFLPLLPDSIYPTMQNMHITEAGVYNILSQLDPHKAEVKTTFLHMY